MPPELWIGDLLRAAAALGVSPEVLLAQFGLRLEEAVAQRPSGERRDDGDSPRGQVGRVSVPSTRARGSGNARRATMTPLEAGAPPPRARGASLTVTDDTTTPPPPLLATATERAVLAAAVQRPFEGPDLDVARVIDTLARGRPLRRLPRTVVWSLRHGVDVLIDRDVPYLRADQERVLAALARLGVDVEVASFRGCPARGVVRRGARVAWRPTRRTVLLLTDLGLGRSAGDPDAPTLPEWQRFGRALARDGIAGVVLLPFPRSRWPAVGPGLSLVYWDRRTSAGEARRCVRERWHAGPAEEPGDGATLAGALTLAARADWGLVRALREALLPHAGVEAEADLVASPFVVASGAAGVEIDREAARATSFDRDLAREVIRKRHERASEPLIAVERALAGEDADEGLFALAATVRDGDRWFARWARAMHAGLPPTTRATPAGWSFGAEAAVRLGHAPPDPPPPDAVARGLVPDGAPHVLYARWCHGAVRIADLGDPAPSGWLAFPATTARVVEVVDGEGVWESRVSVVVPDGGALAVPVRTERVELRSPDGRRARLGWEPGWEIRPPVRVWSGLGVAVDGLESVRDPAHADVHLDGPLAPDWLPSRSSEARREILRRLDPAIVDHAPILRTHTIRTRSVTSPRLPLDDIGLVGVEGDAGSGRTWLLAQLVASGRADAWHFYSPEPPFDDRARAERSIAAQLRHRHGLEGYPDALDAILEVTPRSVIVLDAIPWHDLARTLAERHTVVVTQFPGDVRHAVRLPELKSPSWLVARRERWEREGGRLERLRPLDAASWVGGVLPHGARDPRPVQFAALLAALPIAVPEARLEEAWWALSPPRPGVVGEPLRDPVLRRVAVALGRRPAGMPERIHLHPRFERGVSGRAGEELARAHEALLGTLAAWGGSTEGRIFVSHAHQDAAWARWISERYDTFSPHDIEAGTPIVELIEQGLRRADLTVVLLSPSSLSGFGMMETETALRSSNRLLLVRIAEVEMPAGARHLQAIDLTGLHRKEAERRLRMGIDRALSSLRQPPADAFHRDYAVRFRVHHLRRTGRGEEIPRLLEDPEFLLAGCRAMGPEAFAGVLDDGRVAPVLLAHAALLARDPEALPGLLDPDASDVLVAIEMPAGPPPRPPLAAVATREGAHTPPPEAIAAAHAGQDLFSLTPNEGGSLMLSHDSVDDPWNVALEAVEATGSAFLSAVSSPGGARPVAAIAPRSTAGPLQLVAEGGQVAYPLPEPATALAPHLPAEGLPGAVVAFGHGNLLALGIDGRMRQLPSHPGPVCALDVWNGRVAAGSIDGGVTVDGAPVLPAGAGPVAALAWSPDGERLAIAAADGFRLLSFPSVREPDGRPYPVPPRFAAALGFVRHLRWLDEMQLVVGGDGGGVAILSRAEWHLLGRHGGPVLGLSANATGLASWSEDGAVRVWRDVLEPGFAEVHPQPGFADHSLVRDSLGGMRVVRGGADQDGDHAIRWGEGRTTLTRDGVPEALSIVATCGAVRGGMAVFGAATGDVHVLGGEVPSYSHDGSVSAVAASHRHLASADEWGRVVLTAGRGASSAPFGRGDGPAVRALAFSPSGDVLVAGADDGSLRTWEISSEHERALRAHPSPIRGIAFLDGRRAVVVDAGGLARVHDVTTGACHGAVRLPAALVDARVEGEHVYVATGSGEVAHLRFRFAPSVP